MPGFDDVHAAVERWRKNIKGKFRGIASFEERAQLRFDAIKARINPRRVATGEWQFRSCHYRGWGDYEFLEDWRTIRVGQTWGGPDISAFFKRQIAIPAELDGLKVALQIYVGGDSLVSIDGRAYHGLDLFRSEIPIAERAAAGRTYDVQIESFMNFGGSSAKIQEFIIADLVSVDEGVRQAYWDLWCAAKMLAVPDLDEKVREFVEHHLWAAMKLVPLRETDAGVFRAAVLEAAKAVRETVYATDRFKGRGMQHLVGHSHIDLVFMWPYKEFVRKIGRTHATALRLMEQYPQFRFAQSQAKIYSDLKRYYPELFGQIKRRVAEGRWEPLGAFWVEPDCNCVSGESLVRQVLHGQRFWRQEFGVVSRTCWQPDVFGVSWGLAGILARCGVRYFVTNKMVPWNDTNPWTMNTFWWEGMDGSRVLGIVPPGHFMGVVDPDMLDGQWRRFADKETIGETLHVYGWGDGGGGVDVEMIESGTRYGDFPGLVPTKFSGAEEAFDRIAAKAAGANLPVLRDEIYLEAHRGAVTHKGRLKKLNRRAEMLYRDAEMVASLAWAGGAEYPSAKLDEGWKALLDNQFHDALPGTHITPVYGELLGKYETVLAIGRDVRDAALAALTGAGEEEIDRGGAEDAEKKEEKGLGRDSVVVFNSQPWTRSDILAIAGELVGPRAVAEGMANMPAQQDVTDLEGRAWRLVKMRDVPACGVRLLKMVSAPKGVEGRAASRPSVVARADGMRFVLENDLLRATVDAGGHLVSLYDKEHDREVLVAGQRGNEFQLFEDTPGKYDAWDIVETYKDHPVDMSAATTSVAVEETGPLRASLRMEKAFHGSKVVQRIWLAAGGRELSFETLVDWTERQRLLKVAFPVEINANFATYDIAYGNIARANYPRNSHERARFESPCQQWMDLSQADYGVSVLNDCKYGCDVAGKTMRLTLLKGSISPDPEADKERHSFTYVLYAHAGDWRAARTVERAMNLNSPMHAATARSAGLKVRDGQNFLAIEGPSAGGLTLEAVKLSEDVYDGAAGELVVRVVERHNATAKAALVLPRAVKAAWRCNLMEEKELELPVEGGRIAFTAWPHEIVTLRAALA
jgi:alpha-mannosidase